MPETDQLVILANGNRVNVSQAEIGEFLTELSAPLANPYWRHSGLLSEAEVMEYLSGEGGKNKLRKIARYLLIYTENLAFTAYLFDKAEGKPDQGKELNMPAVEKLRGLYRAVTDRCQGREGIARLVHEMESVCLEIGADPL